MKFSKTFIEGLVLIEFDQFDDKRGNLAKLFDKKIFSKNNINLNLTQVKYSSTKLKGTIRGPHMQSKPFEEEKIVRCVKGRIFDVVIDLRTKSKTYGKWFGEEMSEVNRKCIYIPKGFAHGFQTLTNNCDILYMMSGEFSKLNYVGFRWDDPNLKIKWPLKPTIIAEKDLKRPLFSK